MQVIVPTTESRTRTNFMTMVPGMEFFDCQITSYLRLPCEAKSTLTSDCCLSMMATNVDKHNEGRVNSES